MAPGPWTLCLMLTTCVPLIHSAGWYDWRFKAQDMSTDEMQTTSGDSRKTSSKEHTDRIRTIGTTRDEAVHDTLYTAATIAPLVTTTTTTASAAGIGTEDFEAAFQGKTGV